MNRSFSPLPQLLGERGGGEGAIRVALAIGLEPDCVDGAPMPAPSGSERVCAGVTPSSPALLPRNPGEKGARGTHSGRAISSIRAQRVLFLRHLNRFISPGVTVDNGPAAESHGMPRASACRGRNETRVASRQFRAQRAKKERADSEEVGPLIRRPRDTTTNYPSSHLECEICYDDAQSVQVRSFQSQSR